MNTSKILDSEISGLKVASLPTRPTAPQNFGGKGYTATQMKEAFDKLPMFIIYRFNLLLDDICSLGESSLSGAVPTGISDGHTLRDLFLDVLSGELARYLSVGEESLTEMKLRINSALDKIGEDIEELFSHVNDSVIDAGAPSERNPDTGEVVL